MDEMSMEVGIAPSLKMRERPQSSNKRKEVIKKGGIGFIKF